MDTIGMLGGWATWQISKIKLQHYIGSGAVLILIAVLLLWTPLLNHYPLVFDDTGSYVLTSFRIQVLPDRSIGYSLFIWLTRIVDSLWAVVIAQAIGTAYLLVRVAVLTLPQVRARLGIAFGIVAATIMTTGVSTFVGLIMPDIFASWLFLGIWLFLLSTKTYDQVLAALSIIVAISVHNSHIMLAILFEAGVTLGTLLLRSRFRSVNRRAVGTLMPLVIFTLLGLGLLNLWLGVGFTITRGGSSFLVARFAETGVLNQTLDTYCSAENWTLCGYRELIRTKIGQPNWFLWAPDSPFQKLGWDQGSGEQAQIGWHALQCCLPGIVAESVSGFSKQFWKFKSAEDIRKQPRDYYVFTQIQRWYPSEFASFANDVQETRGTIRTSLLPLDEGTSTIFFLALAIVLCVILFSTKQHQLGLLLLSALAFVTLNAAVTGALSVPSARYQGRVVWLVAYCVFLALASFGSQWHLLSSFDRPLTQSDSSAYWAKRSRTLKSSW